MYMSTCIRNKNCHQHSYGFQNFMSSWGWGSKFSNLPQVGAFSIFGPKGSHAQAVILKIGYFSFFNFRLCTYNVPPGSRPKHLNTRPKAVFGSKSSHVHGVILKIILALVFNFRRTSACRLQLGSNCFYLCFIPRRDVCLQTPVGIQLFLLMYYFGLGNVY